MGARIDLGLELALRSAVGPLFLGLRWARSNGAAHPEGLPAAVRSLALASKIAADELFFATEVFGAASPRMLGMLAARSRLAREREALLDLAAREGWLAEPTAFHRTPPPLDVVSARAASGGGLAHEEISFESGFAPHPEAPGADRWRSFERNRTARARLLRHAGAPRPWVLCVPGYRMGHPRVDFVGFRARWLHETLGLNVAIPVMPLHGPRSVGLRSGDGFLTGDLADTLHAVAQAVWDVRRIAGWLRSAQRAPGIALYGLSLGAATAGLVAGLDPDLAAVIAGIPAADFAWLARHQTPQALLWLGDRAGFPWPDVERLLRLVSPLALPARVPHARRFLFAGLSDRLAPPEHAHALWEHWERPRIQWYAGSHVSFWWEPEVTAFVQEALAASLLIPPATGPANG